MIVNPYETKACVGYAASLNQVKHELEKTLVNFDGIEHIYNVHKTSGYLLLPSTTLTIKPFGHPVVVPRNGVDCLFSDARTMYLVDAMGEIKAKTAMLTALNWMQTRLKLQCYWQSPEFNFVQTGLDYPMFIYGKVISEAIARKYGLEPQAIARVDTLLNYAFWCFSHTEEQWKVLVDADKSKAQLAHLISSIKRSRTEDVIDVISNLDYFHNIDQMVEALKDDQITGTKRTNSLTIASLFEVVRPTWHMDAGAPASEIAACALEHTPTWMANVFSSLTTTFTKNHINQVSQRYKRTIDPNQYVRTVIQMLGGS